MAGCEIKAEKRCVQDIFDGVIPLGLDWHGCCSCPFVADEARGSSGLQNRLCWFDSSPRRRSRLKTKQGKRHENNGDNCAGPQGEEPRGGTSRKDEGARRRGEFEGQERAARC